MDTKVIIGMTYLCGGGHAVGRGVRNVSAERICGVGPREEINLRELCRRFGISPTTGYKWLGRSVLAVKPGWPTCRDARIIPRTHGT